jgi:thiosulfate/3-mercaptopyruvate sulfurtransferase
MHPLISTQALADRLAQGDSPGRLRVFDTTVHLRPASPGPFVVESGRAGHAAGHIPGAAFIDLQAELSDPASPLRFTLPSVAHLEAAFSAAGLSDGDECVLYSSTSVMWATRVWWMLRSLGFEARVLDGGLPKWKAEGRPVATGAPRHPQGRFNARPVAGLWAGRDDVRQAIGDGAVCTLNALTASAHAGSSPVNYGRKGHIRGSVNVPYPALLADDGTLRPVAELRQAFDAVGALARPRVICYCGGGIAATLDALALHLCGHAGVAVYDGSLSEWAADPSLPMDADR